MTKEELEIGISKLDEEYRLMKGKLMKSYLQSINPIKIGDVVEDHYHIIRVESFEYRMSNNVGYLNIIYKGTRLTKKGAVAKVAPDDNLVCLTNVKYINGKSYKYAP